MNLVLLAALLAPPLAPSIGFQDPEPRASSLAASADTPWEDAVQWMREQRDAMSVDLESAHATLLAATKDSAPELARRLEPTPPAPRPTGYGILPEVTVSGPVKSVAPTERRYSLERLSLGYTRDFRDTRMLARRVARMPEPYSAESAEADEGVLEREVAVFERLRGRMRNLEENLSYHEWWQQAVLEQRDYFEDRTRIVALVRERKALVERGGDSDERIAELTRTIHDEIAPFKPALDLALEAREDGWRALPVTLLTDVADDDFLETLAKCVDAEFNGSAAARERRFRIELEIERIPPVELYAAGVPSRGAAVDVEAQIACFPEGRLVLTTGAKSTHAYVGRSLLLGPSPITRRALAHEFGHLLGFSDAYLRGFEGDPSDRFGVVLVEWTGLLDDLMGSPGGGIVTPAMIDRLLEAYGTQ